MEYHEYANIAKNKSVEAVSKCIGGQIVYIRQSTNKDYCFVGYVEGGNYTGLKKPIHKDFVQSVLSGWNLQPTQWSVSDCKPYKNEPFLAKRKKEKKEQLVYCIQSVMGGPIKIGISDYPNGRIDALQTGSPFKLQVLSTHAGGQKLEKRLHSHFSYCNTHGEWFGVSHSEILTFIGSIEHEN